LDDRKRIWPVIIPEGFFPEKITPPSASGKLRFRQKRLLLQTIWFHRRITEQIKKNPGGYSATWTQYGNVMDRDGCSL